MPGFTIASAQRIGRSVSFTEGLARGAESTRLFRTWEKRCELSAAAMYITDLPTVLTAGTAPVVIAPFENVASTAENITADVAAGTFVVDPKAAGTYFIWGQIFADLGGLGRSGSLQFAVNGTPLDLIMAADNSQQSQFIHLTLQGIAQVEGGNVLDLRVSKSLIGDDITVHSCSFGLFAISCVAGSGTGGGGGGGITTATWRGSSANSISGDGGAAMEFGVFKTLDITADFVSPADDDSAMTGVDYDDITGEITFQKAGLVIVDVGTRLTILSSVVANAPSIATGNPIQFHLGTAWGEVGAFPYSDNRQPAGPNTGDGSTRGTINQGWNWQAKQVVKVGDRMRVYGFTALSIPTGGPGNSDVTIGTMYTEIAYIG